jgi:hypothetical protein
MDHRIGIQLGHRGTAGWFRAQGTSSDPKCGSARLPAVGSVPQPREVVLESRVMRKTRGSLGCEKPLQVALQGEGTRGEGNSFGEKPTT